MKRIQSHRGVKGILIMNNEGVPIKSTMAEEDTHTYAAFISEVGARVALAFSTLRGTANANYAHQLFCPCSAGGESEKRDSNLGCTGGLGPQ